MNTDRESRASRPNRILPWMAVAAFLWIGVTLHRQSRRMDSLEAALHQQGEALARTGTATDELTEVLEAIRASETTPRNPPPWPTGGNGIELRVAALETQWQRIHGFVSRHPGSMEVPEYDPDQPSSEEEEPPAELKPWSADQAVGSPNTPTAADAGTAWAPREPDGGAEWLQVGFAKAVEVAEVRVRESFNAGAISRITAQVGGAEIMLWQGVAGTSRRLRDFVVRPGPGLVTDTLTIHLDTTRSPGWNEIDAVALVGRDGSRQWASSARASSSYASRSSGDLERLGRVDAGQE